MLSVKPYAPADAARWNALVASSRNGNWLHLREYMDYHAERYRDASLMVERDGEVVAVLPAHLDGDGVASHAGLSYAGLLSSPALRAAATLDALAQIGEHYRQRGLAHLLYKPVPHLFHAYPAEEDLYALHRLGARLCRRDLSSAIVLADAPRFTSERRRSIARARKAGLRVSVGTDLADFHALLVQVLQRHGAVPTHRLDELRLLHGRFPGRIVLYEVRSGAALLAAALIYDFGRVAHAQYLAASAEGRRLDALSLLLAELIEHVYAQRRGFSLGASTEQGGTVLNEGLVEQKERFGARAVVHDVYEWRLR
ncbi:GNAT family N-acetyltransferase [Lysobacter enzymogenes]|uniref:GNAT family N-acetyltransferase n=1 Tax=Lysobacter enzymogenes TaxID=69 RepID=UPI00089AB2FE|nr:GNAT family N-acetyltransferase [Lysobacter enzymogenes]SDW98903.1 Acetyltransferase (GNAT) domain-containing protein [Lysobacter enzymogenes]